MTQHFFERIDFSAFCSKRLYFSLIAVVVVVAVVVPVVVVAVVLQTERKL